MPRSVRGAALETRTARLRLRIVRKPTFVRVGVGLSLGYRRNKVDGTWVLRISDGNGGASTKAIGVADDYQEADGARVLTFWQAQARATALAQGGGDATAGSPLTVAQAAEVYLETLQARNPRSAREARGRLKLHFLGKFGKEFVADLNRTKLERWLNGLVSKDSDRETVRKSKDTANRILTIVKALLNHALLDPARGITDDHAWRLVKPFPKVSAARVVHFTAEEARSLIAAAPDEAFGELLIAGFLTGARYGELAAANVQDFSSRDGTLHVTGKTGPRAIILHREAVTFFSRICSSRARDDRLLRRSDGSPWRASSQQRPMARSIAAASLDPRGTFYALRHSYISRAIEGEVPLNIIADNCGTSIRMIETTYAKILAAKRREFIERGAPRLAMEAII